MTANPFLQPPQPQQRQFLLGVVASVTNGLYVQIDAGTQARQVSYKRLSSYAPAVGDRVLIARISGTYVVLGKVV